jgi:hypothetical protein
VTVCPPGADPSAIQWPAVRHWVGDAGDLEAERVIELARRLIEAGAESVVLVARNLAEGALLARRRCTP